MIGSSHSNLDNWKAGVLLLAGMSVSPSLLMKLTNIQDGLFFIIVMPVFALCLLLRQKVRLSFPVMAILGIQVGTLLFLALYHGGNQSGNIFSIFTLIGVCVAYLALENDMVILEKFIHAYVLLIVIMLIFAAISSVLAFWGMAEPHPVYERGLSDPTMGDVVYSVGLTLSNSVFQIGEKYFIRASGLFDEPGNLGMMAALALLTNVVILKNKLYELLLTVLGLFTTSLGFYISIVIYLFFWRRKILFATCAVFFIMSAIGFVTELQASDNLIFSQTINRIILLFGTEFGGNRFEGSVAGANLIWDVGLWGLDARQLSRISSFESTAATFFSPFISYGLIGGVVLYAHILLVGMSGMLQVRGNIKRLFNNNSFRVFVVIGISLYHRPSCLYFLYYLLLLSIYLKEKREHAGATFHLMNPQII